MTGVQEPDPQSQFIKDLTQTLRQSAQDSYIIMLDANEDVYQSRHWEDLLCEFDLIDVHRHLNGTNCLATFSRGSTKIDHILVSRDLLSAVKAAGILPFHHGIHSTHRGLFVDLDLRGLIQQDFSPVPPLSARLLRTDQIRKVEKYQKAMMHHLQNQNVEAQINKLQYKFRKLGRYTSAMHRELEKIDNAIMQAAKHAIEKCSSYWHTENWCPEVIEAGLALKFWRVMLSFIKNDTDHQAHLTKI